MARYSTKTTSFIIMAAVIGGTALFWWSIPLIVTVPDANPTPPQATQPPSSIGSANDTSPPAQTPSSETQDPPSSTTRENTIDYNVPFHAQAPLGNWDDPYQANACEEMSLLMTFWHFSGQPAPTAQEAINEIYRLSGVAEDLFGEFRDESTRDTLTLGRTVFPELSFTLVQNPTINRITAELDAGNLVLVPVDGTVLDNPYYTPPGPLYHKLVIRGYDTKRRIFITNDPGTRNGEAFTYTYGNLMDAIGDYSTGFHEPLPRNREKLAIVVSPH